MSDEIKTNEAQATPVTATQPPAFVEATVQAPVQAETPVPVVPVAETPPADVPSFFVKPTDRHRIELDILYDRKTNFITSVSRVGLGVDFTKFEFFGHIVEWFDFSLPTYEDLSTYRQRCSTFRRDAGKVVVDEVQMKNFLLVWHLKDCSLKGADGKKIELSHTPEGALDDESIKRIYALPPTLVEVILANLEKDLILS